MSEAVTKETRRDRTWSYSDGMYISRDECGNMCAQISGKNLPDPSEIRKHREPDPVTCALWDHWKQINA